VLFLGVLVFFGLKNFIRVVHNILFGVLYG